MTKFAFLTDPGGKTLSKLQTDQIQAAASSLAIGVLTVHARNPNEFDAAFGAAVSDGAGGMVIGTDAVFAGGNATTLMAVAARYRLPTIYVDDAPVKAGGLVSYASDQDEPHRVVGQYAGRILKGEKPGDIPVQLEPQSRLLTYWPNPPQFDGCTISPQRFKNLTKDVDSSKNMTLSGLNEGAGNVHQDQNLILAIDVGGTFTDAVAMNLRTGKLTRSKAYTTAEKLVVGQIAAMKALGVDPRNVERFANGTTVVTNALLTRTGSRVALLTTAGFEDSLESGRERRVGGGLSMHDLRQAGPRPLVDRFLRFPVRERIDAEGKVLKPLDRAAISVVTRRLSELNVNAVAICFLFSYLNPSHELEAAEIIRRECPGVLVELSSQIAPEIREYERASTTVIDALTRAPFENYVRGLQDAMGEASKTSLYIMQSNGGLIPANSSTLLPVQILESGPSAGVIAASWIGRRIGYPNIIAFDMGGTTTKACLIRDGKHAVVPEFKADTFYPVRSPSIDLAEVGTGGGSIAWKDEGGSLRVGPRSAGASPGPACYGRGGSKPTVTDAALVLGRLRPEGFLGGREFLDLDAARAAIQREVAEPLGLSIEDAAAGIWKIATAQTAAAVQLISTKRGVDPRDFVLIAYGGAGPLQAGEIALELGIPTVVVPPGAATLSAFGLLVADCVGDASVTFMTAAPTDRAVDIERTFQQLAERAGNRLELEPGDTFIQRYADVRYVGQRWELTVPVPSGKFDEGVWNRVVDDFHQLHLRTYAFHDQAGQVEMVRLHVQATAPMEKPDHLEFVDETRSGASIIRDAWNGTTVAPCEIRARQSLKPGQALNGPALVEDVDTTVWIPPGAEVSVHHEGHLVIRLKQVSS